MIRRVVGILLVLTSIVVAVQLLFGLVYRDTLDLLEVWGALHWIMAPATLVALVVHYLRKRDMDGRGPDGSISREYVEVNVAFYSSILLTIWFFSLWLVDLTTSGPVAPLAVGGDKWTGPLYVLVVGATGCHLWREGRPTQRRRGSG